MNMSDMNMNDTGMNLSSDLNLANAMSQASESLNNPMQGMGPQADEAQHLNICGFGLGAIAEARNPSMTFVQMNQIRARLACPGCLQAFDLELKVKSALASAMADQPPMELQTRISAAIASMDLSQLEITDF